MSQKESRHSNLWLASSIYFMYTKHGTPVARWSVHCHWTSWESPCWESMCLALPRSPNASLTHRATTFTAEPVDPQLTDGQEKAPPKDRLREDERGAAVVRDWPIYGSFKKLLCRGPLGTVYCRWSIRVKLLSANPMVRIWSLTCIGNYAYAR